MTTSRIAAPSGCVSLSETHVELKPGERVLVVGEEANERLLFRAIAGLWPWGGGRIARPPRQLIIFVPTPGYAPPGTLRAALTYPHPPETYDSARISEAFAAVGLEHPEPMLDEAERWDRRLSDNEKQCLAVARVVLQRPRWVVLNRALDGLDPELRRRMQAVFAQHLTDVGVLYIGQGQDESGFFGHTLHLALDPHGQCFKGFVKDEQRSGRGAGAARGIDRLSGFRRLIGLATSLKREDRSGTPAGAVRRHARRSVSVTRRRAE